MGNRPRRILQSNAGLSRRPPTTRFRVKTTDAAAIARFPPEYAAEPTLAHAGGADGLDIVRRILSEAPKHLRAEGTLVCEVGGARALLEHEFPHLPFVWLDTEETSGEVLLLRASDFAAGKRGARKKS